MTAYAIIDKNTRQFVHDESAPWTDGECAKDDWYGFTYISSHAKLYYSRGPAKRRITAYLKECKAKNDLLDNGKIKLIGEFTRGSFIARELEVVEVEISVKSSQD